MLFWAEGSKCRNAVHFTNSDPDMLAFFTRFLRQSYAVPDVRMRLAVNCFLNDGLTLDEIQHWWLRRLELPAACLRAGAVNQPSTASRWRRNVLVYGTARVSVHSTFLVQSIYGAIQEYAGVRRRGLAGLNDADSMLRSSGRSPILPMPL